MRLLQAICLGAVISVVPIGEAGAQWSGQSSFTVLAGLAPMVATCGGCPLQALMPSEHLSLRFPLTASTILGVSHSYGIRFEQDRRTDVSLNYLEIGWRPAEYRTALTLGVGGVAAYEESTFSEAGYSYTNGERTTSLGVKVGVEHELKPESRVGLVVFAHVHLSAASDNDRNKVQAAAVGLAVRFP